jgi:hypothetical protein
MNLWCLAFALMFALDIVWALYTQSMVAGQAVRASSYAAAIQLFTGALVLEYTKDPMLLIPAGLGAFAGTYVVIADPFRPAREWLRARLSGGHKAPPENVQP